jgi:endoglucanase
MGACGTGASPTSPPPADPLDYTGINFWAGAGNAQMVHGGIYGKDYGYDIDGIRYFRESGMNVIRLHLRWEVIQHDLMAPLDVDELGHLDKFVSEATKGGVVTVLAVRDAARYQFANPSNAPDGPPELIGGPRVPVAAFADLWRQLAAHYVANDHVWFNLMNEPRDMATRVWVNAANEAIRAIRETGTQNRILVPGNNWSHGFGWADLSAGTDGVSNAEGMLDVVDPADNAWLDIHEYINGNLDERECLSQTAYSEALAEVTTWLHKYNRLAFLGEFGTGPGETCLAAIEDLLTMLERERQVWGGWAYFSAALGLEDEPLSIQTSPPGEGESPQMGILRRHTTGSP